MGEHDWVVMERNGISFGFIGFDAFGGGDAGEGLRTARFSPENAVSAIKILKGTCHHVVVSIHWGIEGSFYPSPQQIEQARFLVDQGASLVVGHHPHVLQAVERHGHGLIAYSLGNFQFRHKGTGRDMKNYRRTDQTVILEVIFNSESIESYSLHPVIIDREWRPTPAGPEEAEDILSFLRAITAKVRMDQVSWRFWYEELAAHYLRDNLKSYLIRIRRYGLPHLIECFRWLLSPFCVRCYIALLSRRFRFDT